MNRRLLPVSFPVRLLALAALGGAASAQAPGQCPPVWTNLGFHEENVGSALAADGTEAFFGHFAGFSVGVYQEQATEAWTRVDLIGTSGLVPSGFGNSVALRGDTGLVGDSRDQTLVSSPFGSGQGAAVIFERVGEQFEPVVNLLPNNPTLFHAFGVSVSLSHDEQWAAVGASGQVSSAGAVYVYDRAASWALDAELVPAALQSNDNLGASVAIGDDGWLFAGAPSSHVGTGMGRVYVFEDTPGGWVERGTLEPAVAIGTYGFGARLDYEGGRLFVGSPNESEFAGAVYVFEHDGAAWVQTDRITAETEDATASFGRSLDALGDHLAVGAGRKVFAYAFDGGDWLQYERIDDPSDVTFSEYGSAVAWYDKGLLVGGWNHDDNGFDYPDDTGVVYSYDLTEVGQPLRACGHKVFLETPWVGNSERLLLNAPERAGQAYILLGSLTGVGPFSLGVVEVPLTIDAYFLYTLGHPGAPPLLGGLGVLDAEGRAEADFTLPDGLSPDLAGLVTRHAFVTFTGGSNATFASNPVTIAIEL